MTIKAGHLVTSLYSHDIFLVLFKPIIKQGYKKKYLVTVDLSQSTSHQMNCIFINSSYHNI